MSIPLHLVTGFFGSGKTSFLKHYLKTFEENKKIAVIQNEFSSVNMDERELNLSGKYQVLEVNNGSVFCVCLLGTFIESLAAFVNEIEPDEIIMEASGMSDPIGVAQIFQAEILQNKVFLGHVWSIIDSNNYFKTTALRNRIDHQLRIADTIILNKTDLTGDNISQVCDSVKKINPFAHVLPANYAKIELSSLKKAFNFFPNSFGTSEGRPDLNSMVIKNSREINEQLLVKFLENINRKVFRYKGFVKVKKNQSYYVQGVFNDKKIEKVSSIPEPTELVLIGNFTNGKQFQSLFDEYCKS